MTARPEPIMSFEIEQGLAYTPELQRLIADCRGRANDDFINYAIGKLQREGSVERDWPTHITVVVRREFISWSLISRSGHRFSATCQGLAKPK